MSRQERERRLAVVPFILPNSQPISVVNVLPQLAIAAGIILLSFADATLNDDLAIYLPFNEDMANKSTSANAVLDAPEPSAECANLVANGFVGKCLQITTNATNYGYLKLTGTDTGSLAYPNNKTFSAIIWLRQDIELASDPVVFGNNNWNGKAKGFIFAESTEKQVNMHAADGSNRFDIKFTNEARGLVARQAGNRAYALPR